MDTASQLLSRLLPFSAATRLYRLEIAGQPEDRFLVEAWAAAEALHAVGATELIVLSLDTEVSARSLLGCRATLETRLAEGGLRRSSGLIHEVARLGGDGGFCRYRLRMAPWPWLLSQATTSRVWQDERLIEVVDEVFREFAPHADWHWSSDALACLHHLPPRSYTVQYSSRMNGISIWRKLSGIGLKPSAVGGVKPADHLLSEIDKPACPRSWRAVQKQAEENAAAYEAVFDYIPWSWRYSAAGQAAVSYKTIDAALKYWISKSYIKINIDRHTDSGFSKESCVLVTKAVNGGNTHLAIRFAYLSYLEQLLGDYKQTKNTKIQAQRRDKE